MNGGSQLATSIIVNIIVVLGVVVYLVFIGLPSSLAWQFYWLFLLLAVSFIVRVGMFHEALGFFLLGGGPMALISAFIELALKPAIFRAFGPSGDLVFHSIFVPAIEEFLKVLPILAFFLLMKYWRITLSISDMAVCGTACGCGYDFIEETFFGRTYAGSNPLLPLQSSYMGYYFAGHGAYSGLIGLSLGLTRFIKLGPAKWIIPIAAYLWAVFDHGMWNYVVSYPLNPPLNIIYMIDLNGQLLSIVYVIGFIACLIYDHKIISKIRLDPQITEAAKDTSILVKIGELWILSKRRAYTQKCIESSFDVRNATEINGKIEAQISNKLNEIYTLISPPTPPPPPPPT